MCVLKHTSDITDRQAVINESSLMSWLECDQIVQCLELYDYHGSIYIVLELMDGGSLTSIVQKHNADYSEDFCKYCLYMTALGLFKMHSKNVLHRDIKSDNILCSRNGDVKIADLGFSVFLSQQEK